MANELLVEKMISTIEMPSVRQMAERGLLNAPDYFWEIPSSSSGKYHPVDELVRGGLVVHTLKVLYVFETLAPSVVYDPAVLHGLWNYEADCIRCAILLHDTFKNGTPNCGHTVHEHPIIASQEFRRREINNPLQKGVDIIDSLIASHMGKWTQSKYSETILPDPEEYEGRVAKMAKIVHLCDFLAAQKTFLNIQAFRHFMCDEDGLNIPESCFPEWVDQVCHF